MSTLRSTASALLSSQIEGTQSSLSDLLLFELEEAPGVPFDDVVKVSSVPWAKNFVACSWWVRDDDVHDHHADPTGDP